MTPAERIAAAAAAARPRRRISIAGVLIVVTAALCLLAVAFRNDIRSRYWAYRLATTSSLTERAGYLNLLIHAADAAHWGVVTLAQDRRPEIRQFAALAVQTTRTGWSREVLYRLLFDEDPGVRDLAVLALAAQRDEAALEHLERMYRADQSETALPARTACAGLQRFGDRRALAVLLELADIPAPACARAALIDALSEYRAAAAVPALVRLLEDHRRCAAPSYHEELALRALGGIGAAELADALTEHRAQATAAATPGDPAATQPAPAGAGRTVAERAAEALGGITGRRPLFASDLDPAQRQLAREQWEAWKP